MAKQAPLVVTVNADTPAIQKYVIDSMAVAWDACVNALWDDGEISDSDRAYRLSVNPYRKEGDL